MLVVAIHAPPLGAQRAPHLTGTVDVDLERGALRGDVCISGVPVRGDSMTIVLNSALSIQDTGGTAGPAIASEDEPGGATVRHTFLRERGPVGVAESAAGICVEYAGEPGVFDISEGVYRETDSSHVIAFNGRSVRARGAARWYPAPFDADAGIPAEAVSFDITVRCAACDRIYVNGGGPRPGPVARFRSEEPRELLLVAGDLPIGESGYVFLGEVVPPETAARFEAALSDIEDFLESFVGVPYGPSPDIVRLDAVREPRRGQLWGFFSDPALVLIGMSIPELVAAIDGNSRPARRSVIAFLAHELAHRYFGWTLGAASPQRDLYGEPFATYLELKAIRHYFGEDDYRAALENLRERAVRGSHAALDRATPDDFADPTYRYAFAPWMLITLEGVIGEPGMRELLRSLLQDPPERMAAADYTYLRNHALRSGVDAGVWTDWEERCLRQSPATSTCTHAISTSGGRR